MFSHPGVLDLDTQEKLVCYSEVASSSFSSFKDFITADIQEHSGKDLIKSRLCLVGYTCNFPKSEGIQSLFSKVAIPV